MMWINGTLNEFVMKSTKGELNFDETRAWIQNHFGER